MANITNLKMGAGTLTLGGVSLGHTLGGGKLTIGRKTGEIKTDQYGDTPVDYVIIGQSMEMDATLAEPTVDNLFAVMPEAKDAIGGLGDTLGIGVDAGVSLRASAKKLVWHPSERATSDLAADVVMYLAVCNSPVPLNYEFDKQRVFAVKFVALVDETRGNGSRLGQMGQEAIS